MVAQFRTAYDVWAFEPAFRNAVARLRQDCREFKGRWEAHEVRGNSGVGVKPLHHCTMGLLRFEDLGLPSHRRSRALKLVIYTPA